MSPRKKKKKTDYEALHSALMRIPQMNIAATRSLIDMGIREIHELRGRAPEVLFEEARRANAKIPVEQIQYFRMAVYFAENDFPEIAKLHPEAWKHSPTDPSL